MLLSIYRGTLVHLQIKVKDSATTSQRLNGEDVANISFQTGEVVDLALGDYVYLFNKKYTLNLLPGIRKASSYAYEYTCTFESIQYELSKVLFMDGTVQGSDFSLTGNLTFFVTLIQTNLNRISTGWTIAVTGGAVDKTLTFKNENCLAVLQRLCTEFDCDFSISDTKVITVGTLGVAYAYPFMYGKGKGLYSLERKTVDSKNIFTRLYAYGSTKNIPGNYRNYSPRLCLPTGYIESNVDKYGVIEASIAWDEIYPRFTGVITSVDATNVLKFQVSTLDFDVNAYLTAESAKVHFNSGDLSGYEFDIKTYTHASREFLINVNQNEKAINIPSTLLKPKVGDSIVLIGITMPASYITAAETELSAKATTYLGENCNPRVAYTLDIDPQFMRDNLISFNVGDYVMVTDTDLGVNKAIRVLNLEKSIFNPYKWKVDLSDITSPTIINRIISDVEDIKRIIELNRLDNPAAARMSWLNTIELQNMIFDPDGYFDPTNIKPLSITTAMLAVGIASQQFTLNCIIEPNLTGNPAAIQISNGQLVNFSIENTPRTWIITGGYTYLISPTSPYYIYAKCTRSTANTGQMIVVTNKYTLNQDPNYYYFLIGVLHSVVDGVRGLSLTYGMTTINGKFITTGRIQSYGRNSYWDLDSGEVKIDGYNKIFRFDDVYQMPTPPYEVGDLWINPEDIRISVGTRTVTGESHPEDWVKAGNYDNTVTVIKNGLITTGCIKLTNAVGTEYAGISAGNSTYGLYLWAGGSSNVVATDIDNATFAVTTGGMLHSTAGKIGGWTIAKDAIWVGLKQTEDGFMGNNGLTIASNGSIRSKNFYINSNGSVGIRGSLKTNDTGKRIEIDSANNNMTFHSPNDGLISIDSNYNDPSISVQGAENSGEFNVNPVSMVLTKGDNAFTVTTELNNLNINMTNLPTVDELADLEPGAVFKAIYININTGRICRET